MLLSKMSTFYFFLKKLIFSNVYISQNTIFECLYLFFLVEKGTVKSVRTPLVGRWGSCKMLTAAWLGRGCHASLVRTHLHLFSCFWQNVCLIVSCFICRNLTLPLFRKDVFIGNGFYFSKMRNFCRHAKVFCLKLFLQAKISQNAFKFNQIES